MISRRSLLRGLLALPLAPRAAEKVLQVVAAAAAPAPLKFLGAPVIVHPGCDQNSIWLINWSEKSFYELGRGPGKTLTQMEQGARVVNIRPQKNWLKEAIRG